MSQTPDPVSGGWFLYALRVDPANPTFLGDYPKFALWNSGGSPAQDAYFLMTNLFSTPTTFNGVRAYALDRASMLAGGPTHAIGFTLSPADVGDSYSFVAATFRTGNPPPTGRNDFVLAIDSPASGGVTLTHIHGRLFHVDFANPANATFGVGANDLPNAEITVNDFVDAFTNTTTDLVPQQGTATKLDTVGDRIMTPVVYQNLAGTESLWADSTVILNYPTGRRRFAGINSMSRAAIFLLQRFNNKTGPMAMAVDAQHSCGRDRKHGNWLFRIQPKPVPLCSLRRARCYRPAE